MNKRFLPVCCLALLVMLTLAACGDSTISPSGSVAATPTHNMADMKPGDTMGGNGMDAMTESLKGLSGKDFEVKFLQEMIVHHQSALDMAGLVTTNTKRPELLNLAQAIKTTQSKEISDMTGWLASWHNAKPVSDAMSVPGMSQMMGDMAKLKVAKDADFDKMFLMMMIEHHQQAVNMSQLVKAATTQHAELLKLGQDIIKAQTGEIDQMKNWQTSWFK